MAQTQIIEKSRWYEITREVGQNTIRLIAMYTDTFDPSIYAMRIFELRRGTLKMSAKWHMQETKGERTLVTVELQPDAAEELRRRMLSVSNVDEFKRLVWELDEKFLLQPF
jgi:hypothetical protein